MKREMLEMSAAAAGGKEGRKRDEMEADVSALEEEVGRDGRRNAVEKNVVVGT